MIAFPLIGQWEEIALTDTSNRTDPDEGVSPDFDAPDPQIPVVWIDF